MKNHATQGDSPFLRAAAIEGLGQLDDEALLDFLGSLLHPAVNSRKKEERILLTEAVAWAMANTCARIRGEPDPLADTGGWSGPLDRRGFPGRAGRPGRRPDFAGRSYRRRSREITPADEGTIRRALERLGIVVDLLDKEDLLPRTRLQIQLALQHALGTKGMFTAAQSWRHVLERRTEPPEPEKTGAGRTVGI